MANIVPQCKEIEVLLDGNSLRGDIEEFNVPDLEILKIGANACCPPLNFELKVRGEWREILAAVGKPNLQLEIRASIKDNYGEMVPASWKCRGRPMNIPTPSMSTTLKLNAHFYEHIINGEEIFYIDILKYIKRIDGVDHRKKDRELMGLDY